MKNRILLRMVAAAVLGVLPSRTHAAPPLLRVQGNHLSDANGRPMRWHGVNIASLEWSSRGENVLKSTLEVIQHWNANCIRLPLSQDRWFGRAADQKDSGSGYRQIVEQVVEAASINNCYVVLDLHWSNAGEWGQHIGQHFMPDDHSVEFWQAVAARYQNNPAVAFDLYNEPHDVTWDTWQNGGAVAEKSKGAVLSYHTPGMQKLLDVCRAAGAKNVVVAGGLDWAYDLTGIVQGHALADRAGNGVVYATHVYPWKKNWDRHITVALTNHPVLMGEVGCDPKRKEKDENPAVWAPKVLSYIAEHELNWTAWCFHPGASPCLIKDWSYQPTTNWGVYAKEALLGSGR